MDDKIMEILDELQKFKEKEGKFILYKSSRKVAYGNTKSDALEMLLKKLKTDIKKDVKLFAIIYMIDKKYDPKSRVKFGPFSVSCQKLILTPEKRLKIAGDNTGQTIYWTPKELKSYGYEKYYIKEIIRAVDNQTISMIPFSKVTFDKVLKMNIKFFSKKK